MGVRGLVLGFAVGVALCGYAVARGADAVGYDPLIAVGVIAVVIAAFAWLRRGCEFLDFLGQTFVVAYCAYLGFATERIPYLSVALPSELRPRVGRLDQEWPLVLLAGAVFAMILVIVIALPVRLIPLPRTVDTAKNEAFWSFVQAQNDKHSHSKDSGV